MTWAINNISDLVLNMQRLENRWLQLHVALLYTIRYQESRHVQRHTYVWFIFRNINQKPWITNSWRLLFCI